MTETLGARCSLGNATPVKPEVFVCYNTFMDYEGVIIEESLEDTSAMDGIKVVSTKVEPITKEHKTPWLKQWTLHTVSIPSNEADKMAKKLSHHLADNYWYVDFKNDRIHYIIFPNKVFKIDRTKVEDYKAATDYGLKLGIPDYQLDFAPNVVYWDRPKGS